MWETPKRGSGKYSNSITMREMYKDYRAEKKANKDPYVTYKEYANIIKTANKKILNYLVNDAEVFILPYRLGELQIRKTQKSFDLTRTKLAVDYKRSKKEGFIIFHENRYLYSWFWKKRGYLTQNITWYKFEAVRHAKRMVKPALQKKIDYFG